MKTYTNLIFQDYPSPPEDDAFEQESQVRCAGFTYVDTGPGPGQSQWKKGEYDEADKNLLGLSLVISVVKAN